MVKGTDWYSSSIYRAGWKSDDGYVKAKEVSYVGRFLVSNPESFKERVKWWAKSIKSALMEEDEDPGVDSKILKHCEQKGMKVFARK